jgi:hypothetical protein
MQKLYEKTPCWWVWHLSKGTDDEFFGDVGMDGYLESEPMI